MLLIGENGYGQRIRTTHRTPEATFLGCAEPLEAI
jgi:hypothetical protein